MTKKEKIIEEAKNIIRFYSATIRPDESARLKKGKITHIDGLEEPGYWVTCLVFVSEDSLKGEK